MALILMMKLITNRMCVCFFFSEKGLRMMNLNIQHFMSKYDEITLMLNVRGLYDKFMDFCCYFDICVLIFLKFTEKYTQYAFNIKFISY